MFKNYLKTSLRNISRNALFSGINIVGLAISMSVGVLMILFLTEIYSFDQFHEKKDRIYRITSSHVFMGSEHNVATGSIFVANQLKEQVPAVEDVAILRMGLRTTVRTKNDFVNISGFYATPSFFDVFSFELKKGNPLTVLENPNSIVLTETLAEKLFGDEDPLGKTLELGGANPSQNQVSGQVTGIVADPPINSHIQFEVLISLSSYVQPAFGPGAGSDFRTNPGDFLANFIYLTINEGPTIPEIEKVMKNIIRDFNEDLEDPIVHQLQPMSECATSDQFINLPGPTFSQRKIYAMIGLTIIVLLSACFNYTNLSLARSLRRTKEVGIRKVTGATRFHILSQFLTEAVILSISALVLGIGLFYIIKPEFLSLPNPTAQDRNMFLLNIGYEHMAMFFALALIIGLIAGFMPALFMSKLTSIDAFQQGDRSRTFSGVNVRKGLTVFQFTLSIGLIMCTALVYDQYEYAINYELGYETEGIVNVQVKGDYVDVLENEYAAISEVVETSRSRRTLGYSTVFGTAESADKRNTYRFLINEIDHNYLDMHGFKLLAGSNFQKLSDDSESPDQIIINESFLKELRLGYPERAIGTHLWYNDTKLQITGVVEDFVTTSLVWEVDKKFGFIQSPLNNAGILGVKIGGDNKLKTVEKLENIFKKVDPNQPFEADFYDDQLATSYREYKSMYTIVSFLAFLAISISTLGLLGMAVFTVETRMKEISIRKVLGAGLNNLAMLLSKSFLVMLLIASLMAIPITLYFVDNKLLSEFLYRSDFKVIDVMSGFVVVFLIGVITIGWQIRIAAINNPSEKLRNE